MPRAKTILQSDFPYHVSARSHNKQWFGIPIDKVWNIMERELYFIHKAYGVKIHSFVLMSNHFHLLISTPYGNIDKCLWHFMGNTSRSINRAAGSVNQVFGNRHYKCVVGNYHYFMHAYKYIYRNPVHAKLADKCEDYEFSSLNGLLGKRHLFVPIEDDELLFPDVVGCLSWLNKKPTIEDWAQIGLALHRKTFALSRSGSKKPHLLESDTL